MLCAYGKHHFWADDIQVYISFNPKECSERSGSNNQGFHCFGAESRDNSLCISPDKSSITFVRDQYIKSVSNNMLIKIYSNNLDVSNEIKMDVVLDSPMR